MQKYILKNKRFLIIRTDRIGDVVLSTPVLTAIKNSFKNAFTAMLIRPYTDAVIRGHPDLDMIMWDKANQSITYLFTLAKRIRHQGFDLVIVLHPTLRLALLCWLARIPLRVGTGYRFYSFLFNKRLLVHRRNSNRHEADLNLQFVESLGANISNINFKFHIPDYVGVKTNKILLDNNIDNGYIVLHPGSGGSALDWPLNKFAELADKLSAKGIKVVITGSKAEKTMIDRLENQSSSPVTRLDDELDIKELASILKKATLVIANSTGPLHIAVAVGTCVLGLYCPLKACHPDRWGPWKRRNSYILPDVDACHQCKNCKSAPCMDSIGVDLVLEKALSKYYNSMR